MTKKQIRKMVGENIRTQRIARSMSIDELAEILELTPGFIGLIERGERGVTNQNLIKMSDIFGTPVNDFFVVNGAELALAEDGMTKVQSKRKKINSMLSGLADKELDFVITTIKSLRAFRYPDMEILDDEK